MRLSDTIAELNRLRPMPGTAPAATRLQTCPPPRRNPGHLTGLCHVPADLPAGAPLVVVLHGCTQSAAGYDAGAGWSGLADRHGFAVLLPEQNRSNNANLCFNWFQPEDAARGQGEAASIAAMAEAMIERHKLDRSRVFVTGLSAGGAMASVMLATYPDLFAAGAIVAGLPYGGASNLREALDGMAGRLDATGPVLGARVRAASDRGGPWPRVQVWHGGADHLVVPGNGDAVVRQWVDVHGLSGAGQADAIGGHKRRRWTGPDGRVLIEQIAIAGMGHGTPLRPGTSEGESGVAGPHMLDVGLSSTDHIAAFFGIAPEPAAMAAAPKRAAPRAKAARPRQAKAAAAGGVQGVIEDALRAAGLMR